MEPPPGLRVSVDFHDVRRYFLSSQFHPIHFSFFLVVGRPHTHEVFPRRVLDVLVHAHTAFYANALCLCGHLFYAKRADDRYSKLFSQCDHFDTTVADRLRKAYSQARRRQARLCGGGCGDDFFCRSSRRPAGLPGLARG